MKIAFIAAFLALAAPAQAEERRAVRYGDLDLASEAGQDALAARLRSAVRDVCRQASPLDALECRRAAARAALARLPAPARLAVEAAAARAARG